MSSPGPIHSGSVQAAAKATSARHRGPDPDLGEVAQRGREVAHAAGQRQRRLGLAVGAARQQLAHDDGREDDAGQDGEPERRVGRVVPRHALLEDAERHGGGGDDRQLGEVAQRQRGQRGDERGQPVGRVEREARGSSPGRRC